MWNTIHLIAWPVGAFSLAAIIAWLVSAIRIETGTTRQLSDFQGGPRQHTPNEQFGERVAQRLPISVEAWEDHLRWAQRGGYYSDWNVGRLVFVALLYGACASSLLFVNPAPVSLGAPLLAFLYPLP